MDTTRWMLVSAAVFIQMSTAQFMLEVLAPPKLGVRRTVLRCDATGAVFGADTAAFTFGPTATGCLQTVTPADACMPVEMVRSNISDCIVNFALVPRGGCGFSEKAYFAQTGSHGGFRALIVGNNEGEPLITMAGGKYKDDVNIPLIMIDYECREQLLKKFPVQDGYWVQVKLTAGYYDLFRYLIPFLVVIGFCFTVLVFSLLYRVCRERRRQSRKRLSAKNLKKIPTRRYKTGEEPETCAICLDDFVQGEKLRILPCRHVYHCKCIDPWLTKNRKVCPMCKRRVGEKGSDSEDSDAGSRPNPLIDQNRYRELREEPSVENLHDPEQASSSTSHHHLESYDATPVPIGDTEQLVPSDDDSDIEVVQPRPSHHESGSSMHVSSSATSLKEKFKKFVMRVSGASPPSDLPTGLDNVVFDENAVNNLPPPSAVMALVNHTDETELHPAATHHSDEHQFADPFEPPRNPGHP
ncbi:unnamed protein product, partial [Mesorhabditis spiculigera]